MSHFRFVCAAPFALVLTVATSAAPVPKHLMPKDDPPFYMTKVGDRHVSLWQGKDYVCVVTKVEKTADGLVVTEDLEDETGARRHEQTIVVSEKGLRATFQDGKALDPPIWLLKLPHVENNKWTDEWFGSTRHYQTVGWEEIEVPAGKIRAMRVDRDNNGDGKSITTYWYAPGKGCIKWSCGDLSREWKSFTPAK